MVSVRTGSNIPSPNVLTNRTYVDGRSTENLHAVGAIDDAERDLFERTDGVLNNNPVDGRAQIDEMLQMETADQQAALFPDEQALLPQLWRFMEWRPASPAEPLPGMPGQLTVQEDIGLPQQIDFNAPYPIADLPQDLQRTARRAQLVEDGDADNTTISLNDIADVEAAPGRFTQRDLSRLEQARTHIENALRAQAQPNATAALQVPQLGTQDIVLQGTGSTEIRVRLETTLTENRSLQGGRYRQDMNLVRTGQLEVDIPAGHQAIFINKNHHDEVVLTNDGVQTPDLYAGDWRLELYSGGNRVENVEVEIPAVPPRDTQNLSSYVGFDIVDANGQPVDRTPTQASRPHNGSRFATFEYGAPPVAGIDQSVINALRTPNMALAAGSYEVDMQRYGAARVHVVDGDTMIAEVEGHQYPLQPQDSSSGTLFESREARQNGRRVFWSPRDRKLYVADVSSGRDRDYISADVRPNHRIA